MTEAAIPGNRWDLLVPGRDHHWTPRRRVSICVPVRDPDERFTRAIAWLARQTYPHELIELVVADDSSRTPVVAGDLTVPFPVRVVRQDVDRFAAGRARDLAARRAGGDVLVFLDADLLAAPCTVEAYLRWFDRSDLVVPMGFCNFAAPESVDPEELWGDRPGGVLPEPVAVDDQAWRERTLERTDQLRAETADMFRIVVGASLAVSAERYSEAGGFRDVGVRGVEDVELGYRLQNDGAILVPERRAAHWHLGPRTMSGDRIRRIDEARRPHIARLIPVGGFRDGVDRSSTEVSRQPIAAKLLVLVDPAGTDPDVVDEAVERIGRVGGWDVETRVAGSFSLRPETAFAQVVVDPAVPWSSETAGLIVDELTTRRVGCLVVVEPRSGLQLEVVTTRAIRRSCGGDEGFGLDSARRLFGVAAVSAARVGIGVDEIGTTWRHRVVRWARRGLAVGRRIKRTVGRRFARVRSAR